MNSVISTGGTPRGATAIAPERLDSGRLHETNQAFSRDGTAIAYERLGSGPPLILVDGALCSRQFGPMPKFASLLAQHFTVFMYDRRGRGASTDTKPYAKEREVEDIEALIRDAGGSAFVMGVSSGAGLALEAAASGLRIGKLAVYEPPYMVRPLDSERHARADHEEQLKRLLVAGKRGDAVKYFMRQMVGIPAIFVAMMRLMTGRVVKAQRSRAHAALRCRHHGQLLAARRAAEIRDGAHVGHWWNEERCAIARGGRSGSASAARQPAADAERPDAQRETGGSRAGAHGILRSTLMELHRCVS